LTIAQFLNPFPQHTDLDGNPNAFYTVYFGEPNQDPIANPKAPFSDKGLNTPLATKQILTTAGAYAQDIFLDGAYSIRIETPLGSLWRETPSFEGVQFVDFIDSFTVTSMIADAALNVGDFVSTVGYLTAGDGGDNTYQIVASGTGTDDGGSFIDLSGSGHQAKALFPGSIISVAQFGALGSGDDSNEFISTANYIDSLGGGSMLIPNGSYTADNVPATDNTLWLGESLGGVIILIPNGSKQQIIFTPDQSTTTTLKKFSLSRIIFDGNGANSDQAEPAGAAVALNGVEGITIKDCIFQNAAGYGLAFQSISGSSLPGVQTDIYIENCQFNDNGIGTAFSVDTFDGLDVKDCQRLEVIGCRAKNNSDRGLDIRGNSINIVGGEFYDNTNHGISVRGNHNGATFQTEVSISGAVCRNNGGHGILFTEAGSGLGKVRGSVSSCYTYDNSDSGIAAEGDIEELLLEISNCHTYNNSRFGVFINGDSTQLNVSNCEVRSNTLEGIALVGAGDYNISNSHIALHTNTGIGALFASGGLRVTGCGIFGNGISITYGAATDFIQSGSIDHSVGAGDIIPSAATLPITGLGDLYYVTGSTTITDIAQGTRSRKITLVFTSSVTIQDGSGIQLAGGSNINATSNDTLTLVNDGSNWLQIAYSNN